MLLKLQSVLIAVALLMISADVVLAKFNAVYSDLEGLSAHSFQPDHSCPNNATNSHNISVELIEALFNRAQEVGSLADSTIGHLNISNLQVLQSSSDGYACSMINEFVSLWELDHDPRNERTYHKIGDVYFMTIWHNGNHLGFNPIYVFDRNFNPILIAAI